MKPKSSPHTEALKKQMAVSRSLDELHPDDQLSLINKYLRSRQPDTSNAQLLSSTVGFNPLTKFMPESQVTYPTDIDASKFSSDTKPELDYSSDFDDRKENLSSEGRDTGAIKSFFENQKKQETENAQNAANRIGLGSGSQLSSSFPTPPTQPQILGNPNYEKELSAYDAANAAQLNKSNEFIGGLTEDKPLMTNFDLVPKDGAATEVQAPISKIAAANEVGDQNSISDDIDTGSDGSVDTHENPLTARERGAPIDATAELNLTKGIPSAESSQIPSIAQAQSLPSEEDRVRQQLESAQDLDDKNKLLFGLLKAAQMGGAALGGTKADTSFADAELAKGNQAVNRFKTGMDIREEARNISDKNRLRDYRSPASIQARAVAKKIGLNVSDTTTAKELADAGLPIGTLLGHQMTIEGRHEDVKQREKDRQAIAQTRRQDALDKIEDKDKENAGKILEKADTEKARINTPAGREQAKLNAGEHAMQLINDYKGREDKMEPYALHALAMDYATLQSPGSPTEKTIANMSIDTFKGDTGKILGKITGETYGAGAKGYVNSLSKNISSQMNRSNILLQKEMDKIIEDNSDRFHNPKTIDTLKKHLSGRYAPSESSSPKASFPLSSPLPAGRTFTHEGKDYRVNPDGKSATEI